MFRKVAFMLLILSMKSIFYPALRHFCFFTDIFLLSGLKSCAVNKCSMEEDFFNGCLYIRDNLNVIPIKSSLNFCLFVYIYFVCLFVYIFYINNQLIPKAEADNNSLLAMSCIF